MSLFKCPKCEALLSKLGLATTTASAGYNAPSYKMVVYTCEYCNSVLGAEMDPLALKAGIIDEIKRR